MRATVRRAGPNYELRFERRLPHSVERVWRAISDPAELAHWFPSTVEMDLVLGGAVTFGTTELDIDPTLVPTRGTVIALEPPHLLAFTWGEEPLRFELTADGDGCLLTFTHQFKNRTGAARFAAGWSVCLDALSAALGAEPPSASAWGEYYADYEADFGLLGTATRDGAETVVRFERVLPAPGAEVWAALTQPDRLGGWLADTRLEPRHGGTVTLRVDTPAAAVTGHLTRIEAPRVLEYTWTAPGEPDGTVRWQLIPIGPRCFLLLTHTIHGEQPPEGTLAAWDLRLERLAAQLGGGPAGPVTDERFRRLRDQYQARIAATT